MYVLKNALKNLVRNRGRNTLIAVIIFAIITTTVIALIINNTSSGIIDDYKNRFGSEVSISPNMEKVMQNAQSSQSGGGNGRQQAVRISPPSINPKQYLSFGESDYLLQDKCTYTANIGVKCSDESFTPIDYDENSSSGSMMYSVNGGSRPAPMPEGDEDRFSPNMRIYGDSWGEFTGDSPSRKLSEGRQVQKDGECLMSADLAEENGVDIGDALAFNATLYDTERNPVAEVEYSLTVVGFYTDATEEYPIPMMSGNSYMNRRNEVLTTFDTVMNAVSGDVATGFNGLDVSATYYLKNPDMLEDFKRELYAKGLSGDFDVNTDTLSYNKIVAPVEGLKSMSLTFMLVVLILGGVILVLLSSIAIRERKYEIGVLRAMGMKKGKVAVGLWLEILAIAAVCLVLGITAGIFASQPVSDTLLERQVAAIAEEDAAQSAQNANRPMIGMTIGGGRAPGAGTDAKPLENMDVSLSIVTILEIIAVAVLLASVSGIVSISRITKYEPIKILMERN
ncbi:MAG: FtsX-like permease family protein [Oscillospiraceae bacterium]|nr:FtsX-like permease family protein [Oscillospiraceae bacterium]